MATLEEIRRKAKTAAFAATLSSLSVAQAQEIGSAFSEKDALRMEMKTDAQKADVICENPARRAYRQKPRQVGGEDAPVDRRFCRHLAVHL